MMPGVGLRIKQRKNETPEMVAMRAFAKALALVPRHHALAAAQWMWSIAADPKTITKDSAAPNATGHAQQ